MEAVLEIQTKTREEYLLENIALVDAFIDALDGECWEDE